MQNTNEQKQEMGYEKLKPLLHVENLSVQYGDKVIIKDINLTEYDIVRSQAVTGQIIAVLGRSGRGKSTLFKALTGLVKPTTGKVLIPDSSSTELHAAREVAEGEMGFVDQKYTLFRHKMVYKTLMYALRKSSLTTKEKEEKVNKYIEEWGLAKVRKSFPLTLSGGQKQRVAIIEQLFCSGNFIVMDEPFSGLDPINIEDVKRSFDLILSQSEMNTIIFSTHDIELACEIAQSVYLIGYPTLETGAKASYGTIVKNYDFRELGLAWRAPCEDHIAMAKLIKQDLANS